MDPFTALGAAAAAGQFADHSLSILSKLVDLYKRSRKAQEIVADQRSRLQQIKSITDKIKDNTSLQTAEIGLVLKSCNEILGAIEGNLRKLFTRLSSNIWWRTHSSLVAALAEPKTEKLFERLRDQKLDLMLCIEQQNNELLGKAHAKVATTPIPTAQASPQTRSMIWKVPGRHVQHFVGREDVLNRLSSLLDVGSREQRPFQRQRRAVLRGFGGQGKTQIALQYCRASRASHGDRLDAVWWVDASSESQLRACYREMAEMLPAALHQLQSNESNVDYVKATFEGFKRPWIVVYDNFDDLENFDNIEDYIPDSSLGSILFTSRHSDSADLLANPRSSFIEVPGLEPKASQELLLGLTSRSMTEDGEAAQAIVTRLAYHPLAITQAAGFLKKRKLPLSDFEAHYQKARIEILKHTPTLSRYRKQLSDEESETVMNVFATWELSHDQLRSAQTGAKSHCTLLHLSSFLGGSYISERLFRTYQQHGKGKLDDCAFLSDWLLNYTNLSEASKLDINSKNLTANDQHRQAQNEYGRLKYSDTMGSTCLEDDCMQDNCLNETQEMPSPHWNQSAFADHIIRISDLSLIMGYELTDSKVYEYHLHPLIKDWIRLRCPAEEYSTLFAMAVRIVGYYVFNSYDISSQRHNMSSEEQQFILSHIEELQEDIQLWSSTLASSPEASKDQLTVMWQEGLNRVFFYLVQCAFYPATVYQTKASQSLLDTLIPSGLLDNLSGVQQIQEDSNLPSALFTRFNHYMIDENYTKAEKLAQELFELCDRCFSLDDTKAVYALLCRGQALGYQERHEEAVYIFESALIRARGYLANDHWTIYQLRGELATYNSFAGRSAEAKEQFLGAYRDCHRCLGPASPATADLLYKFAYHSLKWGDDESGLDLYRRSVEDRATYFGVHDPNTTIVVRELIRLLEYSGQQCEAEELRERFQLRA